LKELLKGLLEKDINKRIKIKDIHVNEWITKSGISKISQYEKIVKLSVSEDEINNAVLTTSGILKEQ